MICVEIKSPSNKVITGQAIALVANVTSTFDLFKIPRKVMFTVTDPNGNTLMSAEGDVPPEGGLSTLPFTWPDVVGTYKVTAACEAAVIGGILCSATVSVAVVPAS